MATSTWHIITGAYPPVSGGVSAHAAQVAHGLCADGCRVHVWCPVAPATDAAAHVAVHRLAHGFTLRGLRDLGRALDACPGPRTLLVQYTPNALGLRGLNLPFCLWLLRRSGRDDVRVMFHEPFFYFGWRRPWRNGLAVVQRVMAVVLLAASRVAYVSSQSWSPVLRRYAWLGSRPTVWLPIASGVERHHAPERVHEVRRRLTCGGARRHVVGHFGTYGELMTPLLRRVLGDLAATPDVRVLCLGSNGDRFAEALVRDRPECRDAVVAPGFLVDAELSVNLQACDLVVQPYPDGVTTRRTSVMAPLGHDVPVVTTRGPLTEPIWQDANTGVVTVSVGDWTALVQRSLRLLENDSERRALGLRGGRLYAACFAPHHAIAVLKAHEAGAASPDAETTVLPSHPR